MMSCLRVAGTALLPATRRPIQGDSNSGLCVIVSSTSSVLSRSMVRPSGPRRIAHLDPKFLISAREIEMLLLHQPQVRGRADKDERSDIRNFDDAIV